MAMPFLEVRELTRRQRVSPELEKELAMRGVAQAVVYLDPAQLPPRKNVQPDNPRRGEDFGDLDSCFVKDERSVAASLASASLAMTARAPRRNHRQRALAPPRYYSDIPRIPTSRRSESCWATSITMAWKGSRHLRVCATSAAVLPSVSFARRPRAPRRSRRRPPGASR
jgi:hypothetical protein